MEFAIHMQHEKTGEKRIQKVIADEIWEATSKAKVGYGTPWIWKGSEPFRNVENTAVHIERGFYKLPHWE